MPRERKGLSKRESKTRDENFYFIIASEGADTERIYFEALRKKILQMGIRYKLIKIEFLSRTSQIERSQSSHIDVIKQLHSYKKTYKIGYNDELWLVIDRDKQTNGINQISAIASDCIKSNYFLALSNPNFEFWLLLHLFDVSLATDEEKADILENRRINSSKKFIENKLSHLLGGYNKSRYDIDTIMSNVDLAIERAEKFDKFPLDRWIEGSLGTRVYLLVERILRKDNRLI